VLNVAALALVFSATMPMMLLIMAPMLALAFCGQLAELLHVSRRPPAAVRTPLRFNLYLFIPTFPICSQCRDPRACMHAYTLLATSDVELVHSLLVLHASSSASRKKHAQ
jgi:hypothetical protein